MDGDQRTDGMHAERLRKGDFLFRSKARRNKIGCAEPFDKLPRKERHQRSAIVLGRGDDLRQGRPAPGLHSEEAAAERRTILAVQLRRIPIAKAERTRHRPIARLSRHVEHERIGRIERNGAQELHTRSPPGFGSNQEGEAKASRRSRRTVLFVPIRRTRRSPLSSITRVVCGSRASRLRNWRAMMLKPSTCQASLASIRCLAKLSMICIAPASPKPS